MLADLENICVNFRVWMDTDDTAKYMIEIVIRNDSELAKPIIDKYLINDELREVKTEYSNGILIESIYDYLDYEIVVGW